jgi:hypothetical protein
MVESSSNPNQSANQPQLTQIVYSVTATLPDDETARRYLAWLADGHAAEVVAAGALSAQIIRFTDPSSPIRVETRYTFSSSAALSQYVREHAPRLRTEGLKLFPPDQGISFERRVGDLVKRIDTVTTGSVPRVSPA